MDDVESMLIESKIGVPAGAGEPAAPAPLKPEPDLNGDWLRVFAALESLRATLDACNLLTAHPEVKHDLLVLLGVLEEVRGDSLFAAFWRAQHERHCRQQTSVVIKHT